MILRRIAGLLAALALSFGAHAQVAFRAATSAAVPAASTIQFQGQGAAASRNGCGTILPSLPGGTAAGDLLIAVVASGDDSTISMSGWNTFYNNIGAVNQAAALFWRVATGGDPTTITQSGNCNVIIGQIARFTGVDTSQPFGAGPSASFQNAATVTSGSITVPDSGAIVVFTAHMNDNSSTSGLTGFNEAFNSQTISGNDASISLYYSSPATVPPYSAGPYTVTKTRGADPNQGVVFSLRPKNSVLVLNVPAGTTVGDVLIASVANTPSGTTVTPPTGWTSALSTAQASATSNRLSTFYHVVSGVEPASYTFALDGSAPAGAAGEMIGFSGVDNVSPIDAQGGNATASSLTQTATAITTTVPNAMVVGAFEFASSPTAANYNPSGGQSMTKALAQPSITPASNSGVAIVMSYGVQATAGSTGNKSAVASGVTADTGATQLFSLKPASTLNHYSISVSSTTVATCDYAQVTITGHDATHNVVAPLAGTTLTVTTSTATGIWQVGTVSGTGAWTPSGTNNGQATYIWPGGETSFAVRLRQNTAASLSINLNDGSVFEGIGAEDPTITFVDSAFRISDGTGVTTSIGTQISGKPSNTGFGTQTLYLQAVNNSGGGACGTLLPTNTDVTIQVGAQCNNPASCAQNVTLTSSALSGNTATFTPDGGFPASMNFRFTTANSEAQFALNYADAGQITLQFRVQLPGSSPAQYLQGTSNAFAVRPFGLAFPGIAHSNSATVPAAPFAAAGDNFAMTLTAYQWASGQDANNDGVPDSTANITGNGTTPNFAGAAALSATSNLAGVAGTLSRGATCANPASITLAGGTATASDWCYSEVGNVLLGATVSNYLGSGQDVTGTSGLDGSGASVPSLAYVGRFRPKSFAVSNVTLTPRSDLSCASTFTYMDETLGIGLTLTAQNTQGATTQNYTGTYAKLGVGTFANWNFGARSGTTNLSSRIDSGIAPAGSWSNGVANMTFTTAILRASPDTPDGPYSALHLGIAPTDSDTTAMSTLDLDVDNSGGNDHKDLGFTTDVRFGRMRLDNALGAEARQLPVPMLVEYWNGSGFVTNTADNCTSVPRSTIALTFTNLASCQTIVNSDPLTFSQGIAPLVLTAPGAGNRGAVTLTVNLTGATGTYCTAVGAAAVATTPMAAPLPYLRGRWNDTVDADGNPNTSYDDNPGARAGFGLYGSQPGNFIYFRERFN